MSDQRLKQAVSHIQQSGEFVELEAGQDVIDSPMYNEDIAPTKISQRTWSTWNVAALWVGMAICVPTYTLGGVLTSYFGLDVTEALITILVANIIVLIPLTLNAFPGTKFGIPFPVLVRSSFGIYGSNLPAMVRALIACGWFGIQTMFGGMAVHLLLSEFSSSWASLGGTGEVFGFFIFWSLNVLVAIRGSESIKWLETLAAPLLLAVGIGLIFWASPQIDFGQLLSAPPSRPEGASVWKYFFGGLTAMVGFWATLSLNIPDFSRFVRSQKDQVIGQVIGLPVTMFLFATLGVVLTAASTTLVGETISDPISLIGKIHSPFWVILSMIMIIIATISTNIAANVVSPTNDFQNAFPKYINMKRGTLLTGLVGILLMGWELLRKLQWVHSDVSVESMYSNWLLGYSSLLGPIAGIMIVDYFITRKQKLNLIDIYKTGGEYPNFNSAGLLAFFIPVGLTIFALSTGNLMWFYDYGWFTGSALGGILYWQLTKRGVGLNR
ncbi:NCS1 family nucleobase:cation symporter-1 [Geopsychrobacter electrodiphilus]|uniref:NCS1 family nucleobase:cation symporter-1 n=1 Tax=Geopsychrobacter electrodiphilus TaxID=225196 RepID=UPI0003605482|nr:NCS1 family nucleobase:cation symporter-1 [Geopsychrobacter electrodiphilus]